MENKESIVSLARDVRAAREQNGMWPWHSRLYRESFPQQKSIRLNYGEGVDIDAAKIALEKMRVSRRD